MFMLLLTFLLLIKSIQLLLNRRLFSSKKDCFDNNLLLSHNKIKLSTHATFGTYRPGKNQRSSMSSTYERKTLEQLKRSRSAILGVTTKLETKLRPYLDKAKEDITADDLSYLRTIDKQLAKRFEDTGALNSAALERTPDTDSDLEKEIVDAEDFENKIGTQLERISSFLEQFEVSDFAVTAAINASPTSSSSTTGKLKMPKFDLPKFKGHYKDWTPFYEQFMASVDSSTTIADIQKFNYLKAALSGEALQLVSHLPLSNSNFKIALKSLITSD